MRRSSSKRKDKENGGSEGSKNGGHVSANPQFYLLSFMKVGFPVSEIILTLVMVLQAGPALKRQSSGDSGGLAHPHPSLSRGASLDSPKVKPAKNC